MEKKSNGMGIIIFLLILIIIGILCYAYITKTEDNKTISNLETELNSIKSESSSNSVKLDTNDNSDEKSTEINNWNGDISKVDFSNLIKDGVQYESLDILNSTNTYLTISCYDGKITLYPSKELDKTNMFEGTTLKDLGYTFSDDEDLSEGVELKGISDVESVYLSTFGQDFWNKTPVIFLMKDGTLKYDTFENVVKNQISPKAISNLENIVQLYSSSVCDIVDGERMGGAMTTVAVDKNGIAYDLSDYINN